MQLSKMVTFHKAVGDPTRIRIISLLRNGPLHGKAIAGKLGLKPPTITHHLSKLKEAGVVYPRREKNTIYFYLDERKLEFMAKAITRIGDDSMVKVNRLEMTEDEQRKVIHNFIEPNGKLKSIPRQLKKKLVVLSYFVQGLESGRVYEEKEINQYIQTFFADYATIRREWIMQHFMYREHNQYELNPVEMWPVVVQR